MSTRTALHTDYHLDLLATLSERVLRDHPNEPHIRRLQVQALIETGLPAAAIVDAIKSSRPPRN